MFQLQTPAIRPTEQARRVISGLCFLLTASAAISATDTSNIAPEIVALPEFQVYTQRELPPAETWYYARVGNFEILSSTSNRSTKRFIDDFYCFQNVLAVIAPEARLKAELPAAVILCGDTKQFRKMTSEARKHHIIGPGPSAIVNDSEIATILVDFDSFSDDGKPRMYAPDELFYREYVKLTMGRLTPLPPSWLIEGLSRLISKTDLSKSRIEYGSLEPFMHPGPDSLVEVRRALIGTTTARAMGSRPDMPGGGPSFSVMSGFDRNSTRSHDGMPPFSGLSSGSSGFTSTLEAVPIELMPMGHFFALTSNTAAQYAGSQADDSKNYVSLWPKQAVAFVHMCLYGQDEKYRAGFLKLVERAITTEITEDIFKECFGFGYDQMDKLLAKYLGWARHKSYIFKAKNGLSFTQIPEFELRRATAAEVGRLKGEAYRLAREPEAAKEEFVTAYLRGERDPQLLASLGLMARERGDFQRARTYLEQVASTQIPRPRAYVELARARHEAIRREIGPDQKMNNQQLSTVLSPLLQALKLQPPLVETYLEVAAAWRDSSITPTKAHFSVLIEGNRYFPRSLELAQTTADMYSKYGYTEEAEKAGKHASELAARRSDSTRRTAQSERPPKPETAETTTMETGPSLTPSEPNAVPPLPSAKKPSAGPSTVQPTRLVAVRRFEGDYYELRDVDTKPACATAILASYVPSGPGETTPVRVLLAFVVTDKGVPSQIQVRNECPEKAKDAAVKALEAAHFSPGLKNGKPVATAMVRMVPVVPHP
jgi:tetratricopeptide (TPR) repeat protein